MKRKIICIGIVSMFLVTVFGAANAINIKIQTNTNEFFTYSDDEGILIEKNEDFQIYASMGDGTESNPYIIQDKEVPWINITKTDAYFVIRNCFVYDYTDYYYNCYGIHLNRVKNGVIQDSTIKYDRIVEGSAVGIYTYEGENIIIEKCTVSHYCCGIYFDCGLSCFPGSIIRYCDISTSATPLSICVIFNGYVGVIMHHCNIHNSWCGLSISQSDGSNIIHHNNFYRNILNAMVGKPYGVNQWYDEVTNEGNYWDDYHGFDLNKNGIGDNPYTVATGPSPAGEWTEQDPYPLMKMVGKSRSKTVDYPVFNQLLQKLFENLPLLAQLLKL